jgi:hypothetical protein
MDEKRSIAVTEAFVRLYKEGLIYRLDFFFLVLVCRPFFFSIFCTSEFFFFYTC